MTNEMKIKGFGSGANGKWHLPGRTQNPTTRDCRGHPQIGYCAGLRHIKTGGGAGPESAQGEFKLEQAKGQLEAKQDELCSLHSRSAMGLELNQDEKKTHGASARDEFQRVSIPFDFDKPNWHQLRH